MVLRSLHCHFLASNIMMLRFSCLSSATKPPLDPIIFHFPSLVPSLVDPADAKSSTLFVEKLVRP